MYTKETIVKLIKKSRDLRKQNYSIRQIAIKLKVSKDSVNKRINMKFEDECKIKEEYRETRGFKDGAYRKYNNTIKNRIIEIYGKMIEEKSFFINKHTILANYKKIYGEDKENIIPNVHYIEYVQDKEGLHRYRKKKFIKGLSKYMNYPENIIDSLGNIILGIDFVGPRYLGGDSTPYHFLSRRYIRPEKYGKIDLISGQTTQETIKKLVEDWGINPIPDVIRIDNDSAFGMLKSGKTKLCIGTFVKFLLYVGIKPLFSVPRQPWNNGNVEGQNSVFDHLFWQELIFDSPNHLRTEIVRFNTEYKQYSDLIDTSKSDIEKLKIKYKKIDEFLLENKIEKSIILDIEKLSKLKKENFKEKKLYILRKVERVGEKGKDGEIGEIEILGEKIKIDKKHINTIVLSEIDIMNEKLKIIQEIEGRENLIKENKFKIKNI